MASKNLEIFDFPFHYSDEHDSLTFSHSDELIQVLEKLNIVRKRSGNSVLVYSTELPFLYYDSLAEFKDKFKYADLDQNQIVVKIAQHYEIWNKDEKGVADMKGMPVEDSKILPGINYLKLIKFLVDECRSEHEQNNLIDYFDEYCDELIFVSNRTSARLKLPIADNIPLEKLNKVGNVSAILKKSLAERKRTFRIFLKGQIIRGLQSIPASKRAAQLYNNLALFIQRASVDYDVYISELSIDEVKEKYHEFRSKYFLETSNIVKGISGYVIGLPLSTLGGAYAIYKLEDSMILLLLVCLSLLAASTIVISILVHFAKDLRSIYETSNEDYGRLILHQFFENQKEEKKAFEQIHNRLNDKLFSAHRIIIAQYWTTGILVSALLGFSVKHQEVYPVDTMSGVIFFLSFLIITSFGSNLIPNPKE